MPLNNPNGPTVPLTFELDQVEFDEFTAMAEERDRYVALQARHVVRQWIANERRRQERHVASR